MPVSFDSKPFFQQILRPATRVAAAAGVRPNQVTVTTILLSLTVGALVLFRGDDRWPLLLHVLWNSALYQYMCSLLYTPKQYGF